jgi:hypothetical protein
MAEEGHNRQEMNPEAFSQDELRFIAYQDKLKELRAQGSDRVKCASCGSYTSSLVARELTEGRCAECYEEVRFGRVRPPRFGNKNFGRRAGRNPGGEDEDDPAFENGIRALEA